MRQKRLMKFLKYYVFQLMCHPRRANVIADALSHKKIHMSTLVIKELGLIKNFRGMNLEIFYLQITLVVIYLL